MTPARPLIHIPPEIVTLGEAIRWAREQRRITLRALARAVGLSPPFISDMEHDRRNTNRLDMIADVLDVPLSELQERDGRVQDLTDWIRRNPEMAQMLRDLKACRCKKLILKAGEYR